ncbi:conserved hypothetical protein [Leishmania major strain Friedlin]|uniref:Uncharacterized protein n=1 Tax=Leishmania major TaxID=5664 RepID=Q4QEF0_LEIMA|nr:conserved hypothetical protein [Leishmania major strain Friedlin]CAG9572269.1 hypothetical_protein_-_conserved [Leishmania major strain Friedlin]CAJ03525.1 conserved hypothetical protein [Leishmania major strain Friedlin]|eukprot:XP_001682298.1 conserved hypothetical protein [Leishmania major strain Friedlin]
MAAAAAAAGVTGSSYPTAAPVPAAGGALTTCSAAQLAEEYQKLLDVVGTPNYETIQRLFSGDATPPASTIPMIQVSFELFEAVQNRFAATKQVLERTKADLLTRNQHYSLLHQDMLRLKDEYAVLQKRNKEAEERNTQLHQQRAKLEVTVEQLGREVGQGRTALDTLRGKLLHREEELQLSQSRVAESLVTLSQKEAVIGTLRRELGKCGHIRYGPAAGQRDGLREGEGDGLQDGGDGANSHAYTADMLGRIAADVEGRSQEARMKLNMADLEGRLSRLSEEKDSVLAQHSQYRQHVQLALQTYEAEAMLREDTLARHACVYTPYFVGAQEELYAKLVNLQTGEDLATDQRGDDDEMGVAARAEAPPPLQSFGALTFEIRRTIDRLSRTHIDDASRQQQELSLCVDAQCVLLQASAKLVGFLSAMEEEVLRRRLTLPEVREEWHKARVPEFAQGIAQSLQEGASRFGRGLVGLLQQENSFVEELQQARALQQQQQRVSIAGKDISAAAAAASAAGGKGQRLQRTSLPGGTPLRHRSDSALASRLGGDGSYSSMQRSGEAEWRKGSLMGAGTARVPPASASTGDGHGGSKAEGEQVTASTTANRSSVTSGAQRPLTSAESSLVGPADGAAGHAAAPTSRRTKIGGSFDTSEAHEGSATGAADMIASPESQWQSTPNAQTRGGTTDGKDAAASAGQSMQYTPTSLATPPAVIPATTSNTDQRNGASNCAAVAEQVAGGLAALPLMPSVVVCPHCAHDVLVRASAGASLPMPGDGSDGGGARGLLSVPDTAARASLETSNNTSSALASPAGVRAVLRTKSSEWDRAAPGSGAAETTDTQRDGTRLTSSSTAVTKSKNKKKPGSTSGKTGASSKRPKKEPFTGSRGASSSPASSRTNSAGHSRTHGARTWSKRSMSVSTSRVLTRDEQRIGMNSPSIYIASNTSQAVLHSCRSEDNDGATLSAAAGVSAAELALALSDCQDRLAHTTQELQDMQLANVALQAQLVAALAAAAATAPALGPSMPADLDNTAEPNSSAGATGPVAGSAATQKAAGGHQATPNLPVSPGKKVHEHGKPTTTILQTASNSPHSGPGAAEEAVRASGEVVEIDQVATSVDRKPHYRSGSASPTTQHQSMHAGAHRGGAANRDGVARASTAGAPSGGKDGLTDESGGAVPNHYTHSLPSTASSPASTSFPGLYSGTARPVAHTVEVPGTTDSTLMLGIAAARASQSTTALQQSSSTAARAKRDPTANAEAMDGGAEQSRGGNTAGGATSIHNSNTNAFRHERPSPLVSPPPQGHYAKRANGGLAAASATQSQHGNTSTLVPVWGSACLPVLNRRPHALTGATASSTDATGSAALHRAIASAVSIPHKTQTLGLVITNSRVTGAAAMQPEKVEPGGYTVSATKDKGGSHANSVGDHTVAFKLPSASPHSLTRRFRKCALPSLPPLSSSQVPLQQHLWCTHASSSKSGRLPTSSTRGSSPVPMSALPTAVEAGAECSHQTLATVAATTSAPASWRSVLGSNIVSSSLPSVSPSTMPQQSVSAWTSSPISPAVATSIAATINIGSDGSAQLSTNPTYPPAAATALNKHQQRKIAYQQLRLCFSQGASPLYSGRGGAQQPSAAVGAGSYVQVAGWPRGGTWYAKRNTGTRGRLRQVMARLVRGTWVRGHLYEAPIFASPASVPLSDTKTAFCLIVGGHGVHSHFSSPCTASGHPAARTWQDASAQSLPCASGAPIPQALTYLATPAETQRQWSSKRFGRSNHGPFALPASSAADTTARRSCQRKLRTWQQQKRWHIRQSRDAAAAGKLGRVSCASATERVAGSAEGLNMQQLPLTLAQRRAAHLSQFQFAAPSATAIQPVLSTRQLAASDFVSSFVHTRKQRRNACPALHLAKRDPMQRAVKRTVYTVSAASSRSSLSDVLTSTLPEEVLTPLLPSYH